MANLLSARGLVGWTLCRYMNELFVSLIYLLFEKEHDSGSAQNLVEI